MAGGKEVAVAAVVVVALGCCQTKPGRFPKMKSNTFPSMVIPIVTDGAPAKNARRISATHVVGSSFICERACTW